MVSEKKMERLKRIISRLKRKTALKHYGGEPFKILISTILSQRTKDENTIKATENLFSVYTTPDEIADAEIGKIQELIKSSGFYKVKTKRIKEVSRIIAGKYSGRVPDDLDELLQLPGVGRKTANCVLVYGFGKNAIPVDTHVHRISNRLALVETRTPEQTEEALRKTIPEKFWLDINELFVKFGQNICKPINPKCGECLLVEDCKFKLKQKFP
ncbi:MAG: endonuclease III [Candidatus Hydrothermarchaeota archaeon]|nr:endonuclease III [Candidatus Hydrothermarchaeota archaeon]